MRSYKVNIARFVQIKRIKHKKYIVEIVLSKENKES